MSQRSATAISNDVAVFRNFKSYFGAQDKHPRTAITAYIRSQHPTHHVTLVDADDHDLAGFSDAGKGKLTFEPGTKEVDLWTGMREYLSPKRRFELESGNLRDKLDFGRFTFEYKDQTFPVYSGKWDEGWCSGESRYWFILAPKETAGDDGHHPATDALLLDVGFWTQELHNEIYVYDDSEWRKSQSLWDVVQGASWDQVIMDPKVKQNLIDDVHGFFTSQHLYKRFRVPWKRGIILHGVPGNGKTCSVKALMNHLASQETPIPSLYVKSMDNKYNMPQWSVHAIFKKAREMSPCLLMFEDLDSQINEKVRSYFLNEVDGLESNDGILMIATTNHLDKLDPAISKRPSRFDRKYHFRLPDLSQREAYAEFWRQKLTGTDLDFPAEVCPLIAQLTDTFSFAYMKELFVVSLLSVARGSTGDDESSDWEEVSEAQSETPTPPKEGEGETAESKAPEKVVRKPIRAPTIEVPEDLKDNVLLKVVQQQVKALLLEMDNTEEEKKPEADKE